MIKRIMALFLALIMCLDVSITANAAVLNKPTEHIANVVYFVDFMIAIQILWMAKLIRLKICLMEIRILH